jgi:hypothetical protein
VESRTQEAGDQLVRAAPFLLQREGAISASFESCR